MTKESGDCWILSFQNNEISGLYHVIVIILYRIIREPFIIYFRYGLVNIKSFFLAVDFNNFHKHNCWYHLVDSTQDCLYAKSTLLYI